MKSSGIKFSNMVSISNMFNNHLKFSVIIIHGKHFIKLIDVYHYLHLNSGTIYYHLAFKRKDCIVSFNRNHVTKEFNKRIFTNGQGSKLNFISARGLYYTLPKLNEGRIRYDKSRANDLRFVLYENYKQEINHSDINVPKVNQELRHARTTISTKDILKHKIKNLVIQCEHSEKCCIDQQSEINHMTKEIKDTRALIEGHLLQPWYKRLFSAVIK